MGIQGLLPFLRNATEEIHIKEYSGRTVAVDTYCWLHRGSFACADKLAKGEPTDQYVRYCIKYLDMLALNNVRPILVFDGCHLPSKKIVEVQRSERRKQYMSMGKQFLREGKLSQARDAFTKCISVTHTMALDVIKAARARGIDCIVAPYEADAQLAFLLKQGYAQAVITEDSDLLCFGCSKVILKLDLTGRAQEISLDNMGRVKHLVGFTPDTLRYMCILSGCDYLPSIKGIGLVKASNALKLIKSKDIYQSVRKLHQYIKGLSVVDAAYSAGFERADKTFKYQLVMDPKLRKLVPLTPYTGDMNEKDLSYAGPSMPDDHALQIALGNVNVNNGKKVEDFDIDEWLQNNIAGKSCSIWQGNNSNYNPGNLKAPKKKTGSAFITNKSSSTKGKEKIINFNGLFNSKHKTKKLSSEDVVSQITNNNNDAPVKNNTKTDSKFIKHDINKKSRILGNRSNLVVKSRFFEKNFATSQNEKLLNEDNNEDTDVKPKKSVVKSIKSVFDELKSEENQSDVENKSATVQDWIATGTVIKKRKRTVTNELPTASIKNILELYKKDNEIRTPLVHPKQQKIEKELLDPLSPPSYTPKKRKKILSPNLKSFTNHGLLSESPSKKPKRTVIKPPEMVSPKKHHNIEQNKNINNESLLSTDDEALTIHKNKLRKSDNLNESTESIPVIDNPKHCNRHSQKFSKTNSNKKEQKSLKNLTQNITTPCAIVIEDCLSDLSNSSLKDFQLDAQKKQPAKDRMIVISSEEENSREPEVVKQPTKFKKIGLSRKTSQPNVKGKSKYFSKSKASGLRKPKSNNQPTIASMFQNMK